MSFATFQQLPDHNLRIPEFHPAQVPNPPVHNTSETIAPLLHLAKYLSPSERAKRKAAIARANYEYRLYSEGDPRIKPDPLFMPKLRIYQAREELLKAQTLKAKKAAKDNPESMISLRWKRDFAGKDLPAAPEPELPAKEEEESVEPDLLLDPDTE